ncbi:MFS transporter [Sphingobacterium faecium]|uniref:MFS transporter n=1 Tax=Sphingobacterium faecium TaxID=34087 RepID=UPI00246990CD|nr:MFS transporter [Sphingobacterium faecium]MDH5826858.1 MFS transporter [Sphingobacterium faecium]
MEQNTTLHTKKNNTIANQVTKKKSDFPLFQLLILNMVGFVAVMTETMPAGLLPLMARDLNISAGAAGQFISIFALGSVLAGVPIISATAHWPRKKVLLFAIFGYLVFNAATSSTTNYYIMLLTRFCGGMAAGVAWGLLVGYAKRLVSPQQTGKAIALVSSSIPLALAMGVPFATWLGLHFGWYGAFWLVTAVTAVLLVAIVFFIEDFPGSTKAKKRESSFKIFKNKEISKIFLILFLWMVTHYSLYTYLGYYLRQYDLESNLDIFMLIFGFSALLGVLIIGILVDRFLNKLIFICLTLYIIASIFLLLGIYSSLFIYIGIILWGISFGGVPTLLQKRLADESQENSDVAQSMYATIFNSAIAGGAFIGAIILNIFGPLMLAAAITLMGIIKFLITYADKKNEYKEI